MTTGWAGRSKQGSKTKQEREDSCGWAPENNSLRTSSRKKRHPYSPARICENTRLASKRTKTFWHLLGTTVSIMTAVVVISNYFINNGLSFCPLRYFLATVCYLRGGPHSATAFYCLLAESQNSGKPSRSDCSCWWDEVYPLPWYCTHGVFL